MFYFFVAFAGWSESDVGFVPDPDLLDILYFAVGGPNINVAPSPHSLNYFEQRAAGVSHYSCGPH